MSYVCATCGKTHEAWPPDLAFQRPDVVWALPKEERARRCKESDDLCTYRPGWLKPKRHFVRGVLLLPLRDDTDAWGIGLWAEVSGREFDTYLEVFHEDARTRPRFLANLSNEVKSLPLLAGAPVEVQLNDSSKRPTFWFPADVTHPLAVMQRVGVSHAEIHALLEKAAPALLRGIGA